MIKMPTGCQFVNTDELFFYNRNPKNHTDEDVSKIIKSIERNGWGDCLLVCPETKEVLSGNGGLMAAKKLGLQQVPVIYAPAGMTEKQKADMVIASNKLVESSDYNEYLYELVKEFELPVEDLNIVLPEVDLETEIEEYEVPEKVEPICKKGDVWQLGEHRLMCGDSTSPEDIEKLMDGSKADLLITDPPYNVAYEGKTKDKLTIQNDSMDDTSFRQFLIDTFLAANCFLKDGGVFYIWHADSEGLNFRYACKEAGWKVRQCLIWLKNSMVMGRQDYQWKHEPCLYGWKDGASHLWNSDRKQTTILEFDKPTKSEQHPTMKPVNLFAYQIKNSSKQGESVLDLFGGSGTSIVACEQLGRKCYTMELDPHYCDVIIARWEKLTNKKAKRI